MNFCHLAGPFSLTSEAGLYRKKTEQKAKDKVFVCLETDRLSIEYLKTNNSLIFYKNRYNERISMSLVIFSTFFQKLWNSIKTGATAVTY